MSLHIRKIISISLACLFVSISGFAQKEYYKIKVIQDTVQVPGSNEVVFLQKKPFSIQVELQNLEGVYLFAAFKDSIYKLNERESIPDFKNLPSMSMAEEQFNPDQEIIIDDEGWAYWFYDAKLDWHRFDKEVLVSGKQVIATKTIKQFYLSSTEKVMPVAEVRETLYLFFVSAKENKKQELTGELQRYKIKIAWK